HEGIAVLHARALEYPVIGARHGPVAVTGTIGFYAHQQILVFEPLVARDYSQWFTGHRRSIGDKFLAHRVAREESDAEPSVTRGLYVLIHSPRPVLIMRHRQEYFSSSQHFRLAVDIQIRAVDDVVAVLFQPVGHGVLPQQVLSGAVGEDD